MYINACINFTEILVDDLRGSDTFPDFTKGSVLNYIFNMPLRATPERHLWCYIFGL